MLYRHSEQVVPASALATVSKQGKEGKGNAPGILAAGPSCGPSGTPVGDGVASAGSGSAAMGPECVRGCVGSCCGGSTYAPGSVTRGPPCVGGGALSWSSLWNTGNDRTPLGCGCDAPPCSSWGADTATDAQRIPLARQPADVPPSSKGERQGDVVTQFHLLGMVTAGRGTYRASLPRDPGAAPQAAPHPG